MNGLHLQRTRSAADSNGALPPIPAYETLVIMTIAAVVAPCRKCDANVRIAFSEDPNDSGTDRSFGCPRCGALMEATLNAGSADLAITVFTPPESNAGFRLAGVPSESHEGREYVPVLLHRKDGTVSYPVLMWPLPLPETIFVGTSPDVHGYDLKSASGPYVWYSEGRYRLRMLDEEASKRFDEAARSETSQE